MAAMKTPSLLHRMFMYGTLKQTQPNHHHLLEDAGNGVAKFVAKATTMETYPLVIATKYNVPFIIQDTSKGHKVKGEIYDVDDNMLEFLDDFEGHPDAYERRKITVAPDVPQDSSVKGKLEECWCYFIRVPPPSFLKLPHLADYDSASSGRPYQEDENIETTEDILENSTLDPDEH